MGARILKSAPSEGVKAYSVLTSAQPNLVGEIRIIRKGSPCMHVRRNRRQALTVATGTPFGICTIDRRESLPESVDVLSDRKVSSSAPPFSKDWQVAAGMKATSSKPDCCEADRSQKRL
eukprot:5182345-Pleurochrysis_carterae.AAC.4